VNNDARPLRFQDSHSRRIAAVLTVAILLLYGGLFRIAFTAGLFGKAGGVVSLAFVASMPFALGALSVGIGRWCGSDNWIIHALVTPLTVITLGLAICLVAMLEAAICIVMAAPILYGSAILGGLIAHWLLPRNSADYRLPVTFAVFLPLVAAWFEGSLHWPTELKAIEDSITINAPATAIWREIATVPPIPPQQIPSRWIYRVGFPKPIAAVLDREGVGGVRTATFSAMSRSTKS
jgi:hypothetical protein